MNTLQLLAIARKVFKRNHLNYRVKDGSRIIFTTKNIPATTMNVTDEGFVLYTPVSLYENDAQRKEIIECCYKNQNLYRFDQYGDSYLIGKDKPTIDKNNPELSQEYYTLTPDVTFEDYTEKKMVMAKLIIDAAAVWANPKELYYKIFTLKAYVNSIRRKHIVNKIIDMMPIVTFKPNYYRTLFYLNIYYDFMSYNGLSIFRADLRDIFMLKQRSKAVTFFPTLTARSLGNLKCQIQSIVDKNKGYHVDMFIALVLHNKYKYEVNDIDVYKTVDNDSYTGIVNVDYLIKSLYQSKKEKSLYTAAILLTKTL